MSGRKHFENFVLGKEKKALIAKPVWSFFLQKKTKILWQEILSSPLFQLEAYWYSAKLKVRRFTLEITGVQLLLKNRWVLFQAWPQAITKAGLMGESCPPTQPCCTVRALQSLQGVAVRPQHPLSTPPSVGRADMFGNLMPQPLHPRPSSGASAETSSWGKLEETMKIPLSVPRTYPFLALPLLAVYLTQGA